MSNSNKFLSDYIYLAEASYADFSGGYDKTNVELALYGAKDQGGKGKPESLATLVTDNYDVVAHYANRDDESGFSGTLFCGKSDRVITETLC